MQHLAADGDRIAAGTTVARIEGVGHVVLIAERTLLNLVSRASGVATHTRRWADALEGTGARVLDTRKTTPLLRELDKYAVRCGGGVNKRFGLYDCAMIKDNHIVAAGSVAGGGRRRSAPPSRTCRSRSRSSRRQQAFEALDAGVTFLMLDNMAPAAMTPARERTSAGVRIATARSSSRRRAASRLANAADVGATGVDFMSVGALTHSSPILDIALDLR